MSCYTMAIIDSGVCLKDPYIMNTNIINLDSNGKNICFGGPNMHGTYITRIIKREIRDSINIISIKILNSSNKGKIEELCKALKYCIDKQIKIINISLGIPKCYLLELNELIYLCKMARRKGIIIIAAHHNNGSEVFPAILEDVIGICTNDIQKESIYIDNDNKNISFLHNYVISYEKESCLLKGNSYLVPIITGMLYMYSINYELDMDEFLKYLSIELSTELQKEYWIKSFDDIKKLIENKKIMYFFNANSKTNYELISFLKSNKNKVSYFKNLNHISYTDYDIIFIGDLNLSSGLYLDEVYDFAYKVAIGGKDIVMVTPYISLWDRININKVYHNKLISLYF